MLVGAFDLDMTLIDSAPGVADTLTALVDELGAELDLEIPVEEVTARIGPPLHQLLAPYVPAETADYPLARVRS